MTIEEIVVVVNQVLNRAGYAEISTAISADVQEGCDVRCVNKDNNLTLHLYPSVVNKTSTAAVKAALKEIGHGIQSGFGKLEVLWNGRLVVASESQVSLFQTKLSSGQFSKFSDLVKSIERATDRLVAIHLANGLLSNGQKISTARNIDVKSWGSTSEFASGKRHYSLTPLLSVYAPADVYHDFGTSFMDDTLNGLGSVTESSVATAYHTLIQTLALSILKPHS